MKQENKKVVSLITYDCIVLVVNEHDISIHEMHYGNGKDVSLFRFSKKKNFSFIVSDDDDGVTCFIYFFAFL